MKCVVIGANGQLGSDICAKLKAVGDEVIPLNHGNIEIAELGSVESKLRFLEPDVVINTAAMHNVETCEEDPVESFKVNALGARNLAMIAKELDATLVHISTDYVFDGLKGSPYIESDGAKPLNIYGSTKLCGENFIQAILRKYIIVRVSGLYGKSHCRAKGGLNFVKLMLKLAREKGHVRVVNDEILTPTYTVDVAEQLSTMIREGIHGLFHSTAQGACSWFEFAGKVFEYSGSKVKLEVAGPDEFPHKVPRPKYSVLENYNLRRSGLDMMPGWEDGLKRYLNVIQGESW